MQPAVSVMSVLQARFYKQQMNTESLINSWHDMGHERLNSEQNKACDLKKLSFYWRVSVIRKQKELTCT